MKYRVTAPTAVLGHAPGETFEAELDEVQEQRLVDGGHLEYVGDKPKPKAEPEAEVSYWTPEEK